MISLELIFSLQSPTFYINHYSSRHSKKSIQPHLILQQTHSSYFLDSPESQKNSAVKMGEAFDNSVVMAIFRQVVLCTHLSARLHL